ncbi:WD40 repeat domain-containing protein [Deltaproteobacteria bacterium TL4]
MHQLILFLTVLLVYSPCSLWAQSFSAQQTIYELEKELRKSPLEQRNRTAQELVVKKYWTLVSRHNTAKGYELFVKRFPDSPYDAKAKSTASVRAHQKRIVPYTRTRAYQRAFAIPFRILDPPDSKSFGISSNLATVTTTDISRMTKTETYEILSEDLTHMATIFEKHVVIIKIPEGKALAYLPKDPKSTGLITFSRDAMYLAFGETLPDKKSTILVYNISSQKEVSRFEIDGELKAMNLSPDNEHLAHLETTGKIQVWEVLKKSLIASYNAPGATKIAFDYSGVYVLTEGMRSGDKQQAYDLIDKKSMEFPDLFDQRIESELLLSSLPVPKKEKNWRGTVELKKIRPGVYQFMERYLPIAVNTKAKLLVKNISLEHQDIELMTPATRLQGAVYVPKSTFSPGKDGNIEVTSAYHLPADKAKYVQYRGKGYIVSDTSEPEEGKRKYDTKPESIAEETDSEQEAEAEQEAKVTAMSTPTPAPAPTPAPPPAVTPAPAPKPQPIVVTTPQPVAVTPASEPEPEKSSEQSEFDQVVAAAPKDPGNAVAYFREVGHRTKIDKYFIKAYVISKDQVDLKKARALKTKDLAGYDRLIAAPVGLSAFSATIALAPLGTIIRTQYERERIPLKFLVTVTGNNTKPYDVSVDVSGMVLYSWRVELLGKSNSGNQIEVYSKNIQFRVTPGKAVTQVVDLGEFYKEATHSFQGGTRSFSKKMDSMTATVTKVEHVP